MAYFEQKGGQITVQNLISDIYKYYSSQLIQQFHVLVLGLDVLGNPYGLVTDFTEGLGNFFYEPFLVSIYIYIIFNWYYNLLNIYFTETK